MNEFFKGLMLHNIPFVVCVVVILACVLCGAALGIFEIILLGHPDGGVIEILLIAILALAAVFLLLRYRAKLQYFRVCDLNGGAEPARTVLIGEDISIPEHAPGMPEHYRFSQIAKTFETKHLYVLMTRSKIGILLAKDGFTRGAFEDCRRYVEFQRRAEQNVPHIRN